MRLLRALRALAMTSTVLLVAHDSQLTTALADVIYFKSGETLKGLVVEEHQDRIIVNTEAGEQPVRRQEIEEIFYDDPERNYLYLGIQALEGENLALARGFFQKALQIHPRFQEAQDAISRLEDQEKKRQFSPAADPPTVLKEHWGMTLKGTENGPVVQSVREGSPAARSGIAPEDRLISAWGDSLSYRTPEDVAKVLLGPPGSRVKLTLQREIRLPRDEASGFFIFHWGREKNWPGVRLEMERLGLTAMEVFPETAAASAGLENGDRVVAIDGRSTRYLPLEGAAGVIQQARKQGVTLTVRRDLIIQRE